MNVSLLYKTSALLLVVFCAGHTSGFADTSHFPTAAQVILSMKTARFPAQGFMRTFWNFYVGFGLFVSVFLCFAASFCWQLSKASRVTLAELRAVRWALAVSMIANTYLTWMYFFTGAIVFSTLISLCLVLAASVTPRESQAQTL